MKKRSLLFFSLILALFFVFTPVLASEGGFNKNTVHIKEGEIITKNLYLSAGNIIVDGKIAGDLIAIARKIEVNGEISGDLIAIATEIEVNGRIEGNSRVLFNNFNLNGFVGKNINALGDKIKTGKNSFIGWELLSIGNKMEIEGEINGESNLYGENIYLNSNTNKNSRVVLRGENQSLEISPETTVSGSFSYSADKEIEIENKENFKEGSYFNKNTEKKNNNKKNAGSLMFSILSSLLVASFFVYFLKGIKEKTTNNLINFKSKDLLPVLAFLFLIPIIALFLFVTIIGIPLSFLLFSFYFLVIYLAKIVSIVFISDLLFEKFAKNKNYFLFLLLGVSGSCLIFSMPLIGFATKFIATIFGLSALIKYGKNQSKSI